MGILPLNSFCHLRFCFTVITEFCANLLIQKFLENKGSLNHRFSYGLKFPHEKYLLIWNLGRNKQCGFFFHLFSSSSFQRGCKSLSILVGKVSTLLSTLG